jgi:hypothetical protein
MTNLTDQDKVDLERLGFDESGNPRNDRCLLTVWTEVLKSIEAVHDQPIPAVVAHKVVSTWPKLSYQDTVIYHDLYHSLLTEMRELLQDTIAEHPDALAWFGEDDARENRKLYIDLLVAWNVYLDQREQEWDAADETSHIQIAALVDARAFFFSTMGLAGHLNAIGFDVPDDEFSIALEAAVAELKGA